MVSVTRTWWGRMYLYNIQVSNIMYIRLEHLPSKKLLVVVKLDTWLNYSKCVGDVLLHIAYRGRHFRDIAYVLLLVIPLTQICIWVYSYPFYWMVFDPIYLGFDRHQVFLCECPTTQGFHGNHPSTRTSSCSVARPWWRWLLYSGAFMVRYSSTRSVSCPASRFFF